MAEEIPDDKPITQAALNAALKETNRRWETRFDKFGSELLAKLPETLKEILPKAPPVDPEAEKKKAEEAEKAKQAAAAGDEEKRTQKQRIEQLEKKLEASEQRASNEEKERKRIAVENAKDKQRTVIRAKLDAANIKGERLDALLTHLEVKGVLKFDAEAKARMAVKRSRVEGSEPEVEEFDDLEKGVADWLRSESAKEWIPAVVPDAKKKKAPTERPTNRPAQRGSGDQREPTDDEKWENVFARVPGGFDAVKSEINQ